MNVFVCLSNTNIISSFLNAKYVADNSMNISSGFYSLLTLSVTHTQFYTFVETIVLLYIMNKCLIDNLSKEVPRLNAK